MSTAYWVPVYNTGCGDRNCPECGPLIELEIDATHKDVVARTWPCRAVVSEWLGDIYGSGQERGAEVIQLFERRGKARVSRAKVKAERRIKRVLTPRQRSAALAMLAGRPVRATFDRATWLSEVWLELENPTRLVADREARSTRGRPPDEHLKNMVQRAVARAQAKMRREILLDNRLFPTKENLSTEM